MKKKNPEKYVFAPEEKEILLILSSFENELKEKLQESKTEIKRIKYYEKLQISGIDFKNVFITTEEDIYKNTSYHMYIKDSSNEILSVNAKGDIKVIEELKKYLGEIDLEKVMTENDKENGRLRGISERMKSEETEEILKDSKKQEEQENNKEDEESEIVKKDLEEGHDIEISQYKEIKDPYISKKMPEVFANGEKNGIAFSKKLNRFVIVSKIDGKYQLNEKVEPAQATWKSVISIDENGEKIEKKVPHSLMEINNNDEKEIAVTIGQYGEIDIETVEVLPCNERISRGVRMQGEGIEKEESYQVRQDFDTQGKEYSHNLAHEVNKIEENKSDELETNNQEITEEDYIPNTQMKWKQLKEQTGETLPALIERYNKEIKNKNLNSKQAVNIIIEDYENISHEHKRI